MAFLLIKTLQEAWDSYIQNTGMDGMNQAWSMPMDMTMTTSSLDGQLQQGPNAFNGSGGIFMGDDTPGNVPM